MPRRTSAGDLYSLTGGTGDVNPQFLTFDLVQPGNDLSVTDQVQLPIDRMSQKGGKAQIIEVLQVWFQILDDSGLVNNSHVSAYIATSDVTPNWNLANPRVFAGYTARKDVAAAGAIAVIEPFQLNLNDGAGHGYLIATDSIYAHLGSANTGSINIARIKVLYRWKNVGLQEYIGVVQSQS